MNMQSRRFILMTVGLVALSATAWAQEDMTRPRPTQHDVAADMCERQLLGAGFGANTWTKSIWVPSTRETNFLVATPEFKLGLKNGLDVTIPSVKLFGYEEMAIFDGTAYRGTTRRIQWPSVTYTDTGGTLRGVCISYDIDRLLADR